jgi:hypothetical protein
MTENRRGSHTVYNIQYHFVSLVTRFKTFAFRRIALASRKS